MVDLLLLLVSGGNGVFVVLTGLLAVVTAAYFKGRSVGSTSEKNKGRDAYESHLEEIADAADARSRIQPSDSLRHDPYRRD